MIMWPVAMRLRYPLMRKVDNLAWDCIEDAVRRRVYSHTRSPVMTLEAMISDQIERQIEQQLEDVYD